MIGVVDDEEEQKNKLFGWLAKLYKTTVDTYVGLRRVKSIFSVLKGNKNASSDLDRVKKIDKRVKFMKQIILIYSLLNFINNEKFDIFAYLMNKKSVTRKIIKIASKI